MNCEAFREQICIDPASTDAAMQHHESDCAACAAYARRARKAEALIQQALRFDTAKAAAQPPQRPAMFGSVAAALVAGFAFWFGLSVNQPAPTNELVSEILAHMDHEPTALEFTTVSVGERQLSQVLAGEAVIDIAALEAQVGPVTYAKKCVVAGQWMSHIVVQSDEGPLTVLLIPEQRTNGIVPLELAEEGLGGSIVPAGPGSIAVVGEDNAADAQTAQQVAEAVTITI